MSALAPLPVIRISEDDFISKYQPREQSDGNMIHEHHAARQFPINHVWTVFEAIENENMYAVPGYLHSNVIGYLITEVPWEQENLEAVWYEYPDDFEYYDDMSDVGDWE